MGDVVAAHDIPGPLLCPQVVVAEVLCEEPDYVNSAAVFRVCAVFTR